MKQAILMVVAACTVAMLVSLDADAKRLGGGRSVGAPRDVATQRSMTPPAQNAAPAPTTAPTGATAPAAAAAKGPMGTPPVAAQPGWKRWIGPVAGIAAGLGIAALMSHLGLSESFGQFLVILLLVIAAVVIFKMIFRRKTQTPANANQGLQYAGAGAGAGAGGAGSAGPFAAGGAGSAGAAGGFGSNGSGGSATPAPTDGGVSATPMAGSVAAVTADAATTRPYPAGFEPEPFLQQAKINFAQLQAAFDKGESETLRDVMTPDMFAEVSRDLSGRGAHHPTDIVRLNAEILEVVSDAEYHWATVRFHGLTREDGIETPQPFDEAWNLRKAVDGSSGWLLAGIQQLQ